MKEYKQQAMSVLNTQIAPIFLLLIRKNATAVRSLGGSFGQKKRTLAAIRRPDDRNNSFFMERI